MIPTRGTDERFVIRTTIDNRPRGWSLLVGIFQSTIVGEADLNDVYHGVAVSDEKWKVVQTVLKERFAKE
jgi:hypothetical protein